MESFVVALVSVRRDDGAEESDQTISRMDYHASVARLSAYHGVEAV
jgi:hypothetical protein